MLPQASYRVSPPYLHYQHWVTWWKLAGIYSLYLIIPSVVYNAGKVCTWLCSLIKNEASNRCDKQRFLKLTQLLRKPSYDQITIEFFILWMMCFACHIMSYLFCNHQLGIVRCMVNLPLTYAGGSNAILMKLFDFLQQEWTLWYLQEALHQRHRDLWGNGGLDFATPLRSSIKAWDLENPRLHSCHSEKKWVCRTPCRALIIIM